MRKSRSEIFFGKFCVRTKWMMPIRIFLVNKTCLKKFLLMSTLKNHVFCRHILLFIQNKIIIKNKLAFFLIQRKPCR